ncbi:PepSY domain-containing protein [Caulobacter segnis]
MFKGLIRQAHWLLGISLGLVLTVMGVTGAITAFDDEILAALDHGVIRVAPRQAPTLSPDALLSRFAAQRPGAKPTLLTLQGEPGGSARVTFLPAGRAKDAQDPPEKLYLDPYDGHVLGRARGEAFFAQVLLLHRVLLLPGGGEGPGRQVTGAAALALLFFVISGIYLRWPKTATRWRTWLSFDPRQRGRALWRGLHVTAGTWVALVYVLSAVSGLSFSYDWWREGLSRLLTGQPPPAKTSDLAKAARKPGAARLQDKAAKSPGSPALDAAWAGMAAINGGRFDSAIITVPKDAKSAVRIRYLEVAAPHNRAFNDLQLDPRTGAARKVTRFDSLPLGRQLMLAMVAVHRGGVFGLAGRIVVMSAAALMPGFFITGWLLYLDRRRRARAARGVAMAARTKDGLAGGEEILVAFASQTGTAEQLAWRTAAALIEGGRVTRVASLASLDAAALARVEVLLVVAATYGEGEPPDAARVFARKLMASPLTLPRLRHGVLALGDRSHADFCAFGRRLDDWLTASGSRPMAARVEVDGGMGDLAALARWRETLTALGAETPAQAWSADHHEPWTLVERQHLNPGSPGGETWRVALTPPEPARLVWTAGDIAEVVAMPPQGDARAPALRDYSIASLPSAGRVDLLVRQSRLPDGRLGLASGWLTHHAPLGASVSMRVRANANFHPPRQARPMILIGAGTGLAGLRGHLAHRAERGLTAAWLVFGERSPRADRYFADDLAAWLDAGVLQRLDLVFSRDDARQDTPRYVQDVLAQHPDAVRRWMEDDAAIFICGGREMAAAVDRTLAAILGQDRLDALAAGGRYQRDVY